MGIVELVIILGIVGFIGAMAAGILGLTFLASRRQKAQAREIEQRLRGGTEADQLGELAKLMKEHGGSDPGVAEAAAAFTEVAEQMRRAQHLATVGQRANATVVSARATGRSVQRVPELELGLRLEGAASEVAVRWVLDPWAQSQAHVGATVPVRFDPADPSHLVLDTVALRAMPPSDPSRVCLYCAALYPATDAKCPECGAPVRVG